jgi:prepilin-type N-terminal cleavage/methylation domain-containing protein
MWRRVASERGYSLIEMLTVMAILGVVMAGLTTLFVQGSNAEADMNNRFQSQSTARLALDKFRREVHCASGSSSNAGAAISSITLTLPAQCPTGSGSVVWCTSQVGTSTRWQLFRVVGGGACTTGVKWADYLTQGTVFTFTQQSTASLAAVHIDFPVNVKPAKTFDTYELADDIYFRNSTRTCITGPPASPSPPC